MSTSRLDFGEKLRRATRANDSLLCVGLDPVVERLPTGIDRSATGIARFAGAIVAATADLVGAFKPNLAFFEQLGSAGIRAFEESIGHIPASIPIVVDAKRGDVGHSAERYAAALFGHWNVDAVTVNPYLGRDALEPFFAWADRGIFVLCRTSNPGAGDFQDLRVDGVPLYEIVARRVVEWNTRGNAGLVVGATYPDELARIRALAPDLPILIPGVGPQQGALDEATRRGVDRHGELALISASRQVLYASSGSDFAEAARAAALQLRDQINRARRERMKPPSPLAAVPDLVPRGEG